MIRIRQWLIYAQCYFPFDVRAIWSSNKFISHSKGLNLTIACASNFSSQWKIKEKILSSWTIYHSSLAFLLELQNQAYIEHSLNSQNRLNYIHALITSGFKAVPPFFTYKKSSKYIIRFLIHEKCLEASKKFMKNLRDRLRHKKPK